MKTASLITLAALLAACGQAPSNAPAAGAAPETLANTRQVMLGLTIPASDVLFQIGDKTPENDADWERIVATALMLGESGQLLLTGTRNLGQPEWEQHARALVDASKQAAEAARQKDVDQVLEAGNAIYETCDGCHQRFMPARQGETSPEP